MTESAQEQQPEQEIITETTQDQTPPEKSKYELIDDLILGNENEAMPIDQDTQLEGDAPDEDASHDAPEPVAPPSIDYDQEIPMPDGKEPVKLGKLKDAFVEQERTMNQLQSQQNEIMVQRKNLSDLVNAIGLQNLSPQVQQQIQQFKVVNSMRENELMLAAIPEWKESTVFQSDRAEMVELSSQYGLTELDVNNLDDHRWIKMLLDYSKLKQKVKKTQQTFENNTPKPSPKRHISKQKMSQQRIDQVKKNGSQADKLALIDQLIN